MTGFNGKFHSVEASGSERSCAQHHCCDIIVILNDSIQFKITIVDAVNLGEGDKIMLEEAIKVILVCDGTELFTMEFLSKAVVAIYSNNAIFMVNFVEVNDIYIDFHK